MIREGTRKGWVAGAIGLAALGLSGCGGGGGAGGSSNGSDLDDPVITLAGTSGKYSQTPLEANASGGQLKPPSMPTGTSGANQFIRLDVPFDVKRRDVASPDSIFGAFSQLTGNLNITDETGMHVRGIILVNGVDAFGKDRSKDAGFPIDLDGANKNRNLGKGVIVYVADDGDGDLSTFCAFGGSASDGDNNPLTTATKQLRVSLGELYGRTIDAFWTITVADGIGGDTLGPRVLSLVPETFDPDDPLNPAKCSTNTRFIVRFSEPCVPTTVGESAELDGTPFAGNMPLLPLPGSPPSKPLPNTHLTAALNSTVSQLFLPCDVRPLNNNNLAAYIVTPLIDLPAQNLIDIIVVDANANKDISGTPFGAIDLVGNFHSPGSDVRGTFTTGKGRVPVNAPVSPEVFYWLPVSGNGVGAVDLNGQGFNTNTPGRFANDYKHAAIIPNAANVTTSTAILGVGNVYTWPVGTGSFVYGPGFSIGGQNWQGVPTNLGNPGTPVPGLNEMSAGFETLVRNALGDVILTGTDNGTLGVVNDLVIGDFLDAGISDTQSPWAQSIFHRSAFWGAPLQRNCISDPPSPNPPPLRYWVGLNPIDILIDQTNPLAKARLIEGEEVWLNGLHSFCLTDQASPIDPDDKPTGIGPNGPSPQSASFGAPYAVRQQIGNYLYVADATTGTLQVINSNTFQVITSLNLPDPVGVAIRGDNRYVFTANAGDDTMSIIGADPLQSDFHQEISRIPVGRGPREISCQLSGEDVLIANTLDNTISIVELGTQTVRKTLDALIDGPREIVTTARQNGFGWSAGIYFAYIANFTGNSVVVYESGPDGPQGIGCNNVLGALPTEGSEFEMFEPRGMVYSPYSNDQGLYAGGVFVTHRDNVGRGLLSHIQFTHQGFFGPLPCVLPPGQFFIPPGFNVREFAITGQWGAEGETQLVGSKPSAVNLIDFRYDAYSLFTTQTPNWEFRGAPGFGGANSRHPIRFPPVPSDPRFPHLPVVEPDRLYVAFEDTDFIQVLDPVRVGATIGVVNERTGIGIRKLVGYYNSQ